jgi:HSP20 family protein
MATITVKNGESKQAPAMPALRKTFVFDPFADFWKDRYHVGSLLDWALRPYRPEYDAFTFAVDMFEKEGKIFIECELPGFKMEDFDITVVDNRLRIAAKKEEKHHETEAGYAYKERRTGYFERSFAFAEPIDPSLIEATYREGLLRIVFPMKRAAEPKKIAVKA